MTSYVHVRLHTCPMSIHVLGYVCLAPNMHEDRFLHDGLSGYSVEFASN